MNPISRRAFLLFAGMGSASLLTRGFEGNHPSFKEPAISGSNRSLDPWIELNLDNMTWNLGQIKKTAGVKVMAVIKANAYGHGLVEVGKHLERKGIDFLMVGKLQEALLLRENDVSTPILNFGPYGSEDTEKIIRHEISQSVFDEKVKYLSEAGIKLGKKARVHIHVDTGMGRMGISYREAWPFIQSTAALNGILIEGISTALTEDDNFDREQMDRFLNLCQKTEKSHISVGLKHAASSCMQVGNLKGLTACRRAWPASGGGCAGSRLPG